MSRRIAAAVGILFVLGAVVAEPAFGQANETLVVDDDGMGSATDCNASVAASSTIQAGVDAVAVNGTVRVCPGTYNELVVVPTSKTGITVVAVERRATVLRAPANPTSGDLFTILGDGVTVEGLTISGPFDPPADSFLTGILVEDAAGAVIRDNRITQIQFTDPNSGSQSGEGVAVIGASSAEVVDNEIDAYQKTGILVDGIGVTATITGNTITGLGPTPRIAQNGIQLSGAVGGTVSDNDISGNTFTRQNEGDEFVDSAGFLVIEAVPTNANRLTISGNRVFENDVNIYVIDSQAITVDGNTVTGSTKDSGIQVEEGEDEATTTAGNTFRNNVASDNGNGSDSFDCEDLTEGTGTSGTANTWEGNRGVTDSPDGICPAGPPTVIPEVPTAALLPLAGLGIAGLAFISQRRRPVKALAA